MGPVIINAIIIVITEPVAWPLVDTVIHVFDEKGEIRVRTRAISPVYSCYLCLQPIIKIWLNHTFWKSFLFLEDPPLFAVSSSGYTTLF